MPRYGPFFGVWMGDVRPDQSRAHGHLRDQHTARAMSAADKTSTVVTSRFHVQHQGPVPSLQDFYISSRFHEDNVSKGV